MLETGLPVIGCAYPFRNGSGQVVANPRKEDFETGELFIDPQHQTIRVSEVGTGFLLIDRKVIVTLCEKHPELLYKADLIDLMAQPMWALFDVAIVDRRYLSEDWQFCRLWREAGGDVHVYLPPEFRHWGLKGHEGHIMDAWQLRPKAAE
jgi:hypothetical protein